MAGQPRHVWRGRPSRCGPRPWPAPERGHRYRHLRLKRAHSRRPPDAWRRPGGRRRVARRRRWQLGWTRNGLGRCRNQPVMLALHREHWSRVWPLANYARVAQAAALEFITVQPIFMCLAITSSGARRPVVTRRFSLDFTKTRPLSNGCSGVPRAIGRKDPGLAEASGVHLGA